MRKHETAVCRTARTVVWEVGKREVGGKHFYQRLPPTRLDTLTCSLSDAYALSDNAHTCDYLRFMGVYMIIPRSEELRGIY